jgi:magnesium chelatase subunit H
MMKVTVVTLDHHLSDALARAGRGLAREIPGLAMRLHVASEWMADEAAADRCRRDITDADIVLVTQIFMDEQAQAILPALRARRDACDAMVCVMSCPEVMRLTRMGRFSMGGEGGEPSPWSPAALFRRLRGSGKGGGGTGGERQMKQLRRIPKLLRWIPGTAQDVRAYYLVLQYWMAGSEENLAGLIRFLVDRYGKRDGARPLRVAPPAEYPESGVYHPELPGIGIAEDAARLPAGGARGTVGLLLMRSYLLPGNTAHYDAVIRALEARGVRTVPVFAAGLDARPAIRRYFVDRDGRPTVDAVVSLTGFSLVGGPAYNDSAAAQEVLAALDVPCFAAQALEFQSIEGWRQDARGLHPLQATLMVAVPEMDGSVEPLVFGGKGDGPDGGMQPIADRVERLAGRVARLVELRRSERAERRVGVVLFAFPPNAGNLGTAAYLAVWESLHRTLVSLRDAGYTVDVPEDADALRDRVLGGNAERFGSVANVHARVRVDDHVRRERWLREIEAVWGPAPGRQNADGASLWVLGERFGNVFVGIQPAFGYEGDPMRLLFERGFAPTHSFAAFYRWLREEFGAHALLHFGTHGALEFMPGKQAGLGADCWPDRLLGDLPNVYLYASNNPSEGTLAKRRAAATLVSYLTPPITHAGLYRGLLDLKSSLDRWGMEERGARSEERGRAGGSIPQSAIRNPQSDLVSVIQAQAAAVELAESEPAWTDEEAEQRIPRLREQVLELEYSLIPHGLHVIGEPMSAAARVDTLLAIAEAGDPAADAPPLVELLAREGDGAEEARSRARRVVEALVSDGAAAAERAAGAHDGRLAPVLERLASIDRLLAEDHETAAVIRALDGRYVRPAPGGDLLRNPAVLPTGRNLYGFDPFRVPSAFALRDGRRQAERLVERHRAEHGALPETVAMVLWGTDNMKSEGAQIAQALALIGAEAHFDVYGRLIGARLIPLAELGRPRIDVVVTLSGIFRDLLPLQVRLLADAAWLAASADEAPESNLVRKHALAFAAANGCDLETAALRVFSNAEGAYGANVNQLVENGRWSDEDQLAETWMRRKQFAYGRGTAGAAAAPELLKSLLGRADLSYQNLESVELGVADVDQYVDGLGGMARAAARERGSGVPVYIGDQTRGEGRIRTLREQMDLEARTRVLNPRWYDAMLGYGYEGVRQIEARATATLGWSATTGEVSPWVYTRMAETYVLDEAMRRRLAELNPAASARLAGRLLEANERGYWTPDDETLDALRDAADELEDRLEGIHPEVAA